MPQYPILNTQYPIPWQETFADGGDGDGGRRASRDQDLFHPSPNIKILLVKSFIIFSFFIDCNQRKSSNMRFVLILFAPWQETFADAGDVDGRGRK